MSTPLDALVSVDALRTFLAEAIPDASAEQELEIERHQAGHSNETFFLRFGKRDLVLRRPPLGAFLPSAHDVVREYRVLSALGPTEVRAPRTIASCEDGSVIGAPFYLMERMHGDVIRDSLPSRFDVGERARIGQELIDSLVELHAVDVKLAGLEGFGRPDGYLARQLKRWTGQMELTLPHTRPIPDLVAVGEWLATELPESGPSTLVHGDYKLDNVMFAPVLPARLNAILDWEMSTLGDPLADLGWLISFWREPGDAAGSIFSDTTRVTEMEGFSSRDELVSRYQDATGRDVDGLDWYRVLAIWKLAILLEGSYARHLAGMTDDPFFAKMESGVPELASIALDLAKG